jgi:ketoreductase RED2
VVVNSRRSDVAGEELAKSLPEAMCVIGDVSVEADARRLVESALARWGRIDVVVNSAGSRAKIRHDDLDALDDPTWQAMIQANLLGPWYVTRAAVPALRYPRCGTRAAVPALRYPRCGTRAAVPALRYPRCGPAATGWS